MKEEKKKKYRLKKLFPNSPNLGYINEYHPNYGYSWVNPTDYPDFWEEVIEKEYTILKYRNKVLGHILNYLPDWERYFFMTSYWEIYSIERLSDGEVFTIGDNTNIGIILEIKDITNQHNSFTIGVYSATNQAALAFRYISGENKDKLFLQKIKQKLFTTEDQVDIFKGDKFYQLYSDFRYVLVDTNIVNPTAMLGAKFSSEEKLREYIIINKSCVSYKDVYACYMNRSEDSTDTFFEKLKEHIKYKLNL